MPRRLPAIAFLALLVAAAVAPGVAGQTHLEFPASYLRADLTTESGFVEVPRQETRYVGFTLDDRSGDNDEGGSGFPHRYIITASIDTPGTVGWRADVEPHTGIVVSGESVDGRLLVQADPVIRERTVTVTINATLAGADGRETYTTEQVQVRVAPYHQGRISVPEALPRMEPQEAQVLQVDVENQAPYPDTYDVDLTAPEGWTVNAPDRISLLGQERDRVDLVIIAPHEDDRFYYRSSGLVRMTITSSEGGQTTTLDEVAHPVRVEGVYLPPFTLPFLPLLVLLTGAFVHRRRRSFRRGRKEKGPPRDPELSPKQEAMLAELEERDPEKHRRYREKIEEAKRRRKEAYPEHKEAQLESLLEEDSGEGEGS